MNDELTALRGTVEQLERPGPVSELATLLDRAGEAELAATILGVGDLGLRARLVQADAMIRTGQTAAGGRLAREVNRVVEAGDDRYLQARAALVLSRFFRNLGDRQGQLEHAIRSVQLLPADAHPLIRYDHELGLALALSLMGSFDSARRTYERLRVLVQEHGSSNHKLGMLNNAAVNEWEAGELPLALEIAEDMVALAERLDEPLQPTYYETLGRIYLDLDRAADAKEVLLRGIDPQVTPYASDSDAVPLTMLTLAEAMRALGEVDEAGQLLHRCLTMSEERRLNEIHALAERALADLLASQGNFEEAYRHFVRYHDEWQGLTADDRDARVRIIQAVYEATEAREESERYRELSMHDPLTDLANRRYVEERLPALLIEARREGQQVALALIDLDHFKNVNDTYSHEAGDRVLVEVGRILAGCVGTGFAARMGGEEFLLVLPSTGLAEAVLRAEELRALIERHDWSGQAGGLTVTASIGLAISDAERSLPDQLLRAADAALYAAKRGGRNIVVAAPS